VKDLGLFSSRSVDVAERRFVMSSLTVKITTRMRRKKRELMLLLQLVNSCQLMRRMFCLSSNHQKRVQTQVNTVSSIRDSFIAHVIKFRK